MNLWVMFYETEGSVPASQVKFNEKKDAITLTFDPEYTALMFVEYNNGVVIPFCSKDGSDWEICFGAESDGKALPLNEMREDIKKIAELEWIKVEDELPSSIDDDVFSIQNFGGYYHIYLDHCNKDGEWISNVPGVTECEVVAWTPRPSWWSWGEEWNKWDVLLSRIFSVNAEDFKEFDNSEAMKTHEALSHFAEKYMVERREL